MKEHRSRILFWVLLAVLHAAFFTVQVVRNDPFLSDSYEYVAAARNLATAGTLYAGDLDAPIDPALRTKRPPLYPLFLAATGVHRGSTLPALFLQNLLSLLNLLLVVRLYHRMSRHRRTPWEVAILVVFFPSQLVYANLLMSEMLLQTIITAAFYGFTRYVLGDGPGYVLAYNLLIAAAPLVKPVMYLFVLPNAVLMLALSLRRKDARPVVYSLLPLLAVAGTCALNAYRTGLFHFSSIQSASLLDYNTRYFLVHSEGAPVAERLVDAVHMEADQAATFAERQRRLHAGAWELLRPRLFSYLIYHLTGSAAFFLDPGRFDLYQFFGISSKGPGFLYHFSRDGISGVVGYLKMQPILLVTALMGIVVANVLRVAALVAAAFTRTPAAVRWGLLLLIGYLALVTGPVGAARFAVPVFPLTVLGVLLALAHRRRRSSVRSTTPF